MKKIILLLACCCALIETRAQNVVRPLSSAWQFRKQGDKKWMRATVPGTVHTDLMANKVIPDPYYRDNENNVQWVSGENWEYQTTFDAGAGLLKKKHLQLIFEGLDTYADVYLNGVLVLTADNMFRTWKMDIGKSLRPNGNLLFILLHSPDKTVDSLARMALPLVRPCENNRHYVRKAQYHYGWDWGPKLTTSGIWRPVKIIGSDEEEKQDVPTAHHDRVKLVQEPDAIGTSFYFTVDGQPTFMKGANWIPADMFLPRITKKKYRDLLIAAKHANINMLRVWGGGIYEDDYFYDLCDSLGIYVWQDFMFAGAMYPADAPFLENVKQEAIDNIKRLRRHSCIVLWCGNNEIDEAWHNWGWQSGLSETDVKKLWDEYQQIFEELLPQLVKEYDDRPYVSSSPKHGWGKKESMTDGDSHYWGLWHGLEPISVMKQNIPRFMSEYGMQAMPGLETVKKYALPSDWDTSSVVMKVHQKHRTGYQNLARYLEMENLHPKTFPEYILATQEIQSRALATTIEAEMNSNGRCMGTLFWQFNDCWPVCSWSVVDYYGLKKKAYYTVQKAYKVVKRQPQATLSSFTHPAGQK